MLISGTSRTFFLSHQVTIKMMSKNEKLKNKKNGTNLFENANEEEK